MRLQTDLEFLQNEIKKLNKKYNGFHRMVRVSRDAKRYRHNDICFDKKTHKKLRSPLTIGEKVLVLAKRLRKKDAPGSLYKNMTENISFFNREEIFIVRKVLLQENSYNYWISKTADNKIINKRFLRQELFALKN